MKLSQFKFNLPENLIAQYPSKNRDECRLMVVNAMTGEIQHRTFKDILEYFDDGDVMVFNNTRVFPARLYGNKEKTGARIEVFLLRELNADNKFWDVLVEPARKIRIGNKLYFGPDESMVAEVIDNTTSRGRELLKRLEIKGVERAFLTLHSGRGNYREIDVEDLTKHRMDSEDMDVDGNLVDIVNAAKDRGNAVCAVGTSVLRAIATSVCMNGHIMPTKGWTNKFIFPPYEFSVCTSMVSNFHMPYSTMLMMVSAFGGYDLIMKAYAEAVKEGYKFGAYGDAMLILRAEPKPMKD